MRLAGEVTRLTGQRVRFQDLVTASAMDIYLCRASNYLMIVFVLKGLISVRELKELVKLYNLDLLAE